MTEAPKRRRRLSKGALRALAWIAGGAAFAAPFASLTAWPKPATASAVARTPGRRVVVVKKITRRVVVHPAPTPSVQYVYTGSGSSGSSSSSSSSPSSSSSSSNSGPATSGSAPPATTSTGGS